MKFSIFLIPVFYCLPSFAQDSMHQQKPVIPDHDLAMQYLEKSKRRKKTGSILAISGTACLTAALVIALVGLSQWSNNTGSDGNGLDNAGTALTITGSALVLVSIPFLYSAKHNKKKADLLLRTDNVLPAASSNGSKKIFSVGVAIHF